MRLFGWLSLIFEGRRSVARLTVADLQEMKRNGRKLTAAVIYDVPMLRIFERAGVDVISIGDSFAHYLFDSSMDDVTVDEILVFAKAVIRKAERPVLSIDVPIGVCSEGPAAVYKAAQRFKSEAGPDLAKIDLPSGPDMLLDEVRAVMDAGLGGYCRVRYRPERAKIDPGAEHDHVVQLAQAVEKAGVSLIDLYQGTPEVYRDVARSVRIPVIGGQWSTGASDGKIFIYPNFVGYRPDTIDRTDGRSASRFIYDLLKPALDEVHAGAWQPQP
jgi:3-methyl-2-oxobutanoate hydroxymethyltransferase